jgi:hypothetical protein
VYFFIVALYLAVALLADVIVAASVLLPLIITWLFPVIAVVALFVSANVKFEKVGFALLATAFAVNEQVLLPTFVLPE